MLVLTRRPEQSIMIGDDVEVTILSIAGDRVRVGVSAPRDVAVFRKEVYLEIESERGQVTPLSASRDVDQALSSIGSSR